jgi:glucosamine-6-phosphate deaminase
LLVDHPVDVCCLGIGENGHLAFNDPPVADFDDPLVVKVVALDERCKQQQVGEGHFATLADVPPRAITVTVPGLLRARHALAIVPEVRKAAPVRAALEGPYGTACPATFLRTHPRAVLYLDADSASQLT